MPRKTSKTRYAERTTVPVGRTQDEIRKMVQRRESVGMREVVCLRCSDLRREWDWSDLGL